MSRKDEIIERLKENGCRITKQRKILIDIILENDCASCKEIFYKASQEEQADVRSFWRTIPFSGCQRKSWIRSSSDRCKRHYVAWCRMSLKFYLKGYRLSAAFQKQLDGFILQAREREEQFFGGCDLELVAITSRKDYRKGLGTALVSRFMDREKSEMI